jgi:hypothetical protein
MASNEVELFGEVGTGSLLPGGKFGIRVRRSWVSRREDLLGVVVSRSGKSLDELGEVFEQQEDLGDLYVSAAERVMRVGDSFYREALARLVAAAVDGSTPVDEAEALADRLVRLDVASLRLMFELYRPREDKRMPGVVRSDMSTAVVLREVQEAGAAQLIDPALAQLEAVGFLEREWLVQTAAGEGGDDPQSEVEIGYERTSWGRQAYEICLAHEVPRP